MEEECVICHDKTEEKVIPKPVCSRCKEIIAASNDILDLCVEAYNCGRKDGKNEREA